ncbi:MAG: alanine racemase [Phycisphaeraceae bacterium]
MAATSRIHIDLTALDHNCRTWREVVGPGCRICAVVKADAYGLGAVAMTRRLAANHVDMLAVYSAEQASELVTAAASTPILILMPVEDISRTDALYRPLVAGRLHLALHSMRQLEKVDALGRQFGTAIPVHVEVDTGMNRLGTPLADAEALIRAIRDRRYLKLAGLLSHAAAANNDPDYTHQQHARFDQLLQENAIGDDVLIHFAGTFAAMRHPSYHRTMVRLGLGLFGYGPDNIAQPDEAIAPLPPLKPIVRWVSNIVHVKDVPAGAGVGYNLEHTTSRPSRLAIVPVGYGDGYPWSLRNQAIVRVGESLWEVPVRGQINMDQIIIDITPPTNGEAGAGGANGGGGADIGTEVELISDDPAAPNALHKLAAQAGSTCYETLCRLSPRVQRRYLVADRTTGTLNHAATV